MSPLPDRKRTIFLYSNQPVVCCNGRYYTKMKNFIDFLAELARQDAAYRLIVPCKAVNSVPKDALLLQLPEPVLRVSYYEQHWEAISSSLSNALKMRLEVNKALDEGDVVFAGPGPNAALFFLSFILPRKVRFAFFIRGDKTQTLRNIYRGSVAYPIVMTMAKLLLWRVNSLLGGSRAKVFLYNEKMKSLFNGRDSDLYFIAPLIDGSLIRTNERADMPEGRPLKVLYLGRLSGEKNVSSLLKACAIAQRKGAPFDLSIAGFGPQASEVSGLIAELGLQKRVTMLGYVKNGEKTIELFDTHDIFCLPSHTEATPRAVIEAMARAMPVVSTPVGSLPYLFREEIRFTDGFGPEHILSAIEWCGENRRQASMMGRKGSERVRPFVIEDNVKRVDEVLRLG